jgi:hypothetical protein
MTPIATATAAPLCRMLAGRPDGRPEARSVDVTTGA